MNAFSSRHAGALLIILLASGCGGGGSSGVGGGEPIGTPAPPSTPSPTPTPPPTSQPTPAPSPTYETVFDFARDQSFVTQVAEVRVTERYKADAPRFYVFESAQANLHSDVRAATIDYRAGPQSLTVAFGTETATFASQTLTDRTNDVLRYARNEPDLTTSFRLVRPAAGFRYLGIGTHAIFSSGFPDNGPKATFDVERLVLTGNPTLLSDLPTSGAATYSGPLITTTVSFDGGSGLNASGKLSFDFASSQVNGTFVASQGGWATGTTPVRATLVFAGSALNGYIRGKIASPDSGYSGEFVGRMFGPGGAEMGLLFTIVRDGKGSAGQVAALKN